MISSFKQYLVEEERHAYFTLGRMNPPTIGHGKLIDKLSSKAGRNPYKIFLTQTQDSKKNPLSYPQKVKFARKMFRKHARNIVLNKKIKTVMNAAVDLYDSGFRSVTMVVGDDRVREFNALLNNYNGKRSSHGLYNFKEINVVSAGERDPDSESASGASATKQREAASDNDFTKFSQGLPKDTSNKDAKSLFNAVRLGMGLKEETEFKNKVKLDSVSEIREKFVSEDIFKVGDQVVIKETDEVAIISHRGSNYVILEKSDNTIVRKWLDAIEALDAKGLQSIGWDKYKKDSKKSMNPDYPDRGTDASVIKAVGITPGQAMATITPGKKLTFKKFTEVQDPVKIAKARAKRRADAIDRSNDRRIDRAIMQKARMKTRNN
tara:strand:+ start:681 stop:1814 length:1134 start_codon:yes stop_codon:yes gene_type:complete